MLALKCLLGVYMGKTRDERAGEIVLLAIGAARYVNSRDAIVTAS